MPTLPGSSVSLFQSGVANIGSAVSDLFQGLYTAPAEAAAATAQADAATAAAQADVLQGQGDILEGQTYGEAATLAQQNAQYTAASTAIQEVQAQRSLYMTQGATQAAAGASGLASSGSVADVMRSSAEQGALNQQVIQQQGLITEAGYQEQAKSYELQQQAAGVASQAENVSAQGETQAAAEYTQEANLLQESGTGDFISSAISGISGVAELALGLKV